jgi:hypothetical protein
MGSVLYYERAPDRRQEIWGANFRENYVRLLSNPTLLNWSGNVAQASLLENIHGSNVVPWPKVRLWQRLLDFLGEHPEFGQPERLVKIGYDWRRSLPESATDFAATLRTRAAAAAGTSGKEVRFTFITHSMGGLLLRCAIGQGAIDPRAIDRVIHIGAPLEGAPSAFLAAYQSGGLPFLQELSRLIKWRNAQQFFDILLKNVQTFPSIYQLMPPVGRNFLFFSLDNRANPLDPSQAAYIPPNLRQLAIEAHSILVDAERTIIKSGVKVYTIHTELHSTRPTDIVFRVQPLPPPTTSYRVLEVVGRTREGDGTVPAESARGGHAGSYPKPLANVTHASMCNNEKVVDLLPTIL